MSSDAFTVKRILRGTFPDSPWLKLLGAAIVLQLIFWPLLNPWCTPSMGMN